MKDIIKKAEKFATKAHSLQRRKYTNEPYIIHPKNVCKLVSTVTHTKEMLIAALLHDVVEDTHFTLDDISKNFGSRVTDLVYWLTDISKSSDGNRSKRKEIDRNHIASAPKDAKTIKLADLIDNSDSIIKYDQTFAKVFLSEKMLLLEVLKDGNKVLWNMAYNIVKNNIDLIE